MYQFSVRSLHRLWGCLDFWSRLLFICVLYRFLCIGSQVKLLLQPCKVHGNAFCCKHGGQTSDFIVNLCDYQFFIQELWLAKYTYSHRWLSWMRRPTGDQEVAGSTPAEVGNILSCRLIMKYFLRSFSSFRWFKKGSCQFLAKECAQYWLTT